MKKRYKKAFSLIELSIVILIISILAGGSLAISSTRTNNAKIAITKARMDTVYKAFTTFLATNKRLPCPALLNIAKDSSTYGKESGAAGTCTGNNFVSTTNAPHLIYGAVPVVALGLDPDFAEDAWGTKFDYVVYNQFTIASTGISSNSGFEITKGNPSYYDTTQGTNLGYMDIQGPGADVSTPIVHLFPYYNGIFTLISHGANKYNGWNATGTTQNGNTGSTNDENSNTCSPCSSAGTTSFNNAFVSSSTNPNFDDIVLFKNKSQLVIDAGLEFIMCSAAEAATINNFSPPPVNMTWGDNATIYGAHYSCNLCSHNPYYTTPNYYEQATCGRYGAWSSYNYRNTGAIGSSKTGGGGWTSNTVFPLGGPVCTPDTEICPDGSKPNTVDYIQAYSSVTQSILSATTTAVTFNQTLDSSGDFGFPTDNVTFIPPIAGYWLVSYTIVFPIIATKGSVVAAWIQRQYPSFTGTRYGFLELNYYPTFGATTINNTPTTLSSSAVIYFNGTSDSFAIGVYHNVGSSILIGGTGTYSFDTYSGNNTSLNTVSAHFLHS